MSNIEVVQSSYDAFARGDVPAVLANFDPGIEWREAEGNPYNPDGSAWVGPDAVAENLFMKIGAEWDGFTVTPNEIYEAGDTVVAECRYTGTFKATGKSIDGQFCHVWKLRDGKLTSFQQYGDTAQLQDVMGAREPAGAGAA